MHCEKKIIHFRCGDDVCIKISRAMIRCYYGDTMSNSGKGKWLFFATYSLARADGWKQWHVSHIDRLTYNCRQVQNHNDGDGVSMSARAPPKWFLLTTSLITCALFANAYIWRKINGNIFWGHVTMQMPPTTIQIRLHDIHFTANKYFIQLAHYQWIKYICYFIIHLAHFQQRMRFWFMIFIDYVI